MEELKFCPKCGKAMLYVNINGLSGWYCNSIHDGCDNIINDLHIQNDDREEYEKFWPEIIRCKECKYSHLTNNGKLCAYCDKWTIEPDSNALLLLYLDNAFFCGHGKRK